jgi:hypothetical protein
MARIGPAEVRERYGLEPEQVPDWPSVCNRRPKGANACGLLPRTA